MDSTFDDEQVLSYTDAQIVHYFEILPRLPESPRITSLSAKYVAKHYHEEEAEDAIRAMEFASRLGVRVPRIKRIVHANGAVICIMDRIQGAPLDTEWLKLGWIASIRLAFQLRRTIRRLRSVQSSTAGSLATGECRSFYLDDTFGLPHRASLDQVNAFINFWVNFVSIGHEVKKTPAHHSTCSNPAFSTNQPFVFTHHDLAPRNIILDPAGQLWLIDWDYGGFYPKFFEYAGMHNFITTGWSKSALRRWKLFTWVSGGAYDRQNHWLRIIRSRITRFRPARRFNMMANGYAAAARRPCKDS
ncbi:ankyrin repeat protein [Stachybotrys elegans]|uniref:Ankyrin repeat protein n=1 Tax=Stachybotrys elegans TaxID=80388 RepID=A0A8K0WN85_9HYPO|nr:ankyrin repeat protein [Stachybotrys elegans]